MSSYDEYHITLFHIVFSTRINNCCRIVQNNMPKGFFVDLKEDIIYLKNNGGRHGTVNLYMVCTLINRWFSVMPEIGVPSIQ